MKKLLVTSALVAAGFASTASAQSVLERVLGEIDNSTNLASVNGTFANIAENIGGPTAVNSYSGLNAPQTPLAGVNYVAGSDQAAYDAFVAKNTVSASYADAQANTDNVYYNPVTGEVLNQGQYNSLTGSQQAAFTAVGDGKTLLKNADGSFNIVTSGTDLQTALNNRAAAIQAASASKTTSFTGPAAGIDGSILNIVDGITDATQTATAGVVNAIEYNMPSLNWGNMSTTVLGAVNTGEITLGVNQSVEQAKTTSTGALSSLVDQIGGSADTGALVLNVASNMTGVNGSIRNTMTEVNGTVGNLGTTVLGAVNTGTITSGVNAAVSGIVGGGTSQTGGIAP